MRPLSLRRASERAGGRSAEGYGAPRGRRGRAGSGSREAAERSGAARSGAERAERPRAAWPRRGRHRDPPPLPPLLPPPPPPPPAAAAAAACGLPATPRGAKAHWRTASTLHLQGRFVTVGKSLKADGNLRGYPELPRLPATRNFPW